MHLINVKLLLFLYFSIFNLINNKISAMSTYPCNIQDSVILEESQKLPNGSYYYDDTLIPEHLVYESRSIIYGCICLIKNCVSWCCSNKYQSFRNSICNDEFNEGDIHDNVTLLTSEKTQSTKKFFEYFHIQKNKKIECSKTYALNFLENDYDEWHIFDNGTIYQPFYEDEGELAYAHKDTYCFALKVHEVENGTKLIVTPHFCQQEPAGHFSLYGISLLVSQVFIFAAIALLLIKSKQRTIHVYAVIGYLSSLSISYFCLAYILLGTNHEENFKLCTSVGYIAYFTILSAYYWLCAIGCDLYYSFNIYYNGITVEKTLRNKVLLKYAGIAHGIAIIYTIFAYLVQNSTASNSMKPGFGDNYCYLNVASGYSALTWMYIPLILVVTYNFVMFIMLCRKFNIAELLLKRNSEISRNKFLTFLYLFIVMGLLWVFEIISYFIGTEHISLFFITDLHNISHGLLILLFVISRKRPEIPY